MRDALDRQAIRHARQGDRGALRFLFMRYERTVRRHVRIVTADPDEAEAITRAVFADLARALEGYDPAEFALADWLGLLARNVATRWERPAPYVAA